MKIYFPELVQLHNYPSVNAQNARFSNWKTLNGKNLSNSEKVFKKLKFQIHHHDITGIISASPGSIERVLFVIFNKIKKIEQEKSMTEYNSVEGSTDREGDYKINSEISAQLAEKEDTIQ